MQSPLPALTDDVFQELGDKHRVVLPDAFPASQWQSFLQLAQQYDAQGKFREATVAAQVSGIRGDRILWLDDKLAPEIFEILKAMQKQLNQGLYTGITHFECHFACYPPGKGYETHIDQKQSGPGADSERVISFVLYLNSNWHKHQGGQLEIQLNETLSVEPQGGTLVLFDSRLVPHRVLAATQTRWSLTGWFRRWSNSNYASQS